MQSFGVEGCSAEEAHATQLHRAQETAKSVFGVPSLRPQQRRILSHIFCGRSCLVVLPTGSGKSLPFQLAPLVAPVGVSVVISPLLALIRDQSRSLKDKHVACFSVCTGGDSPEDAVLGARKALTEQRGTVIYTTPESLRTSALRRAVYDFDRERNLRVIAIDEAHCVSEWGLSFRKSYRELSWLAGLQAPVLACTATAAPGVLEDTKTLLGLVGAPEVRESVNRPDIRLEVFYGDLVADTDTNLVSLARAEAEGAGIVYCRKRDTCDSLAGLLLAEGISAASYHAGLSKDRRLQIQQDWMDGKTRFVVATIAFGMGIDKFDVRLVVHYNLPKSLEGLVQETGRASRDGKGGRSVVFFSAKDARTLEFLVAKADKLRGAATATEEKAQRDAARKVIAYCKSFHTCRREVIARHFGEALPRNACNGTCDVCADPRRMAQLESRFLVGKTAKLRPREAPSASEARERSSTHAREKRRRRELVFVPVDARGQQAPSTESLAATFRRLEQREQSGGGDGEVPRARGGGGGRQSGALRSLRAQHRKSVVERARTASAQRRAEPRQSLSAVLQRARPGPQQR